MPSLLPAKPRCHVGPIQLPCPVLGGYVVLVDKPDAALRQDPHNWSDVVAFTTGGPAQPGVASDHYFYFSDVLDPTTNTENGITDADLAFAGLSVAIIVDNPTTVYIPEGVNTQRSARESDAHAQGDLGKAEDDLSVEVALLVESHLSGRQSVAPAFVRNRTGARPTSRPLST